MSSEQFIFYLWCFSLVASGKIIILLCIYEENPEEFFFPKHQKVYYIVCTLYENVFVCGRISIDLNFAMKIRNEN